MNRIIKQTIVDGDSSHKATLTKAGEALLIAIAVIFISSILFIVADNTPTIIRQCAGIIIGIEVLVVVLFRIDKITAATIR